MPLELAPVRARENAIVLIKGIFLHRDELEGEWDLSVFLGAPGGRPLLRRAGPRPGTTR